MLFTNILLKILHVPNKTVQFINMKHDFFLLTIRDAYILKTLAKILSQTYCFTTKDRQILSSIGLCALTMKLMYIVVYYWIKQKQKTNSPAILFPFGKIFLSSPATLYLNF